MSEKEYIERGKLKDHYSWLWKDATLTPKDFDDIIDAQPAADVEPVVRAHWEREFKEVPVREGSRCVMKVLYKCAGESGCKEYSIINSKRCPNCGAHMERSGSGE